MESAIKILERAIDELKKPVSVYVVIHGKTGKVESVWSDKSMLLSKYKTKGYVHKECNGHVALFPEELTYNDMFNGDFYKVQSALLDVPKS